jgi:predicted DsbA family dithiol-disulfide isomerase
MKIEIYSDVACPWCYIGDRRFRRALAAFPGSEGVEVVFRSFQLDPGAPEQPVSMVDYLRRKFGGRVEEVQRHVADAARGEGVRINFERGVIVNTLTAHRLLRLAEHEYGSAVQRDLADRLFEAYFEHGADVADHRVLADLATGAGMDPERVRGYLASEEGLRETRDALAAAAALGVRAVPTFVFDGRHAIEGAQPTSTFLRVLEQLSADASLAAAAGEADAACTDDGCAA